MGAVTNNVFSGAQINGGGNVTCVDCTNSSGGVYLIITNEVDLQLSLLSMKGRLHTSYQPCKSENFYHNDYNG